MDGKISFQWVMSTCFSKGLKSSHSNGTDRTYCQNYKNLYVLPSFCVYVCVYVCVCVCVCVCTGVEICIGNVILCKICSVCNLSSAAPKTEAVGPYFNNNSINTHHQ